MFSQLYPVIYSHQAKTDNYKLTDAILCVIAKKLAYWFLLFSTKYILTIFILFASLKLTINV